MLIFGIALQKDNANKRHKAINQEAIQIGIEPIVLIQETEHSVKKSYETFNNSVKNSWHSFLSFIPCTSLFNLRCECANHLAQYRKELKQMQNYVNEMKKDAKFIQKSKAKKVRFERSVIEKDEASQESKPDIKPEKSKPQTIKKKFKSYFFFRTDVKQVHAKVAEDVYIDEPETSIEKKKQ